MESQKIRDSEPRRTLIRSSYPDVQWRRLSKEDRLRERGFHHKVSMKKSRKKFGGGPRRIYTRGLTRWVGDKVVDWKLRDKPAEI